MNSPTPVTQRSFNADLNIVGAQARASTSVGAAAAAFAVSAGYSAVGTARQDASAQSSIDDFIISGPSGNVDVMIQLPFDIRFSRYYEDWSGNGNNFSGYSSTDQSFALDFGGYNVQTYDTLYGDLVSGEDLIHITYAHILNDPQISFTFRQDLQFVTGLTTTNTSNGLPAVGYGYFEEFSLTGLVAIHQLFPVGTPIFLEFGLSTRLAGQRS